MKMSRQSVKFDKMDTSIKCICITSKGDIIFVRSIQHLKGYSIRVVFIRDLKWFDLREVGKTLYASMCVMGGVIINGDDIQEVFPQDHKKRHVVLHKYFMKFLKWSPEQTQNPIEKEGN